MRFKYLFIGGTWLSLSLTLSFFLSLVFIKKFKLTTLIWWQITSENVMDRLDYLAGSSIVAQIWRELLKIDAIKAIVFREIALLRYLRRSFRILLSTQPEQEREAKKGRVHGGGETSGKGVKNYSRNRCASSLWPSKQNKKTRVRVPAFLPLKLCRRLKEDRSFVSLI